MNRSRSVVLSSLLAAALGFAAACGSGGSGFGDGTFNGSSGGGAGSSGLGGGINGTSGSGGDGSTSVFQSFTIDPATITLTVTPGQPLPTAQFHALGDGQPVQAAWTLDRGELGSLSQDGLFSASGTMGGTGTLIATAGSNQATAHVILNVHAEQNGTSVADAGGGGVGGRGGVGGDPEGGAVDAATATVLASAPTAATGLTWLYPYDQTVFPRGILAPQLQWRDGGTVGNFDAVRIDVSEAHYSWTGTFAKNASTFENHPLPSDVWRAATQSNEGEDLVAKLTFAKGGVAYGPIEEHWKIAGSPLKGVVYYNSYGTSLAQNYEGAKQSAGGAFPGNKFGGATLSIHGGSTDPALVAGSTGGHDQCYVCHTVSLDGSRLLTHYNSEVNQSSFDLATGTETKIPRNADPTMSATYTWPGPTPDGKYFLSDQNGPTQLYEVPTAGGSVNAPLKATTGLPADLTMAFPTFSADGTQVAFNRFGGAGSDKRTLSIVSFDPATFAFGEVQNLFTVDPGQIPIWPSFVPGGAGLLYEHILRPNDRPEFGGNRSDATCESDGSTPYRCDENTNLGTRAEIWFYDSVNHTRVRLDRLNGLGALPTGAKNHGSDETLNYEPAVSPVVSGGYAWVVFTSRRLYGNIATINPWWSDPRYKDISVDPTTKKLWVAAIDLNAPAGTDPSHPAFYLPAQELMAGNSRGFWVVDPCRADGNGCESGDECCGGFCRPGAGGALVCSNAVNTCSNEFESCATDGDCCGSSLTCIDGRCGAKGHGPN